MPEPRHVEDLETPVIVVDLDVVERNVERAQRHFDGCGVAFRPHVKTHKIPELARLQLAAGAAGLACQKLSEAEVMIREAGAADVFLPYNLVGEQKARRLAGLLQSHPEAIIAVGADSQEAAATADLAGKLAGRTVGVLVECDTGGRRAGVASPADAVELAFRIVDSCPHVELRGFFTYPSGSSTGDLVGETAELFLSGGLPLHTVSGGGTPTMWDESACAGLTEYRAGTYVFFDRNSIGAGAATIEDCALRVLTTVVSRPTATRAVLDAGSKTLTSDLWLTAPDDQRETFGLIVDARDAVIYAQSEEHGHVDVSACASPPAIGDRLAVIPNHCCVTTNLHDTVYGVRDGVVEQAFTVAARGRVW